MERRPLQSIWLVTLALVVLLVGLGQGCSCGTIQAPTCDLLSNETHPDWKDVQTRSEMASTPRGGVDACLQVAWGDVGSTEPSQAVTQYVKFYKGRLYRQGPNDAWDQNPDISLPPGADGKKLRFTVFFFRNDNAYKFEEICTKKISQVNSYRCTEEPECAAGYVFVPPNFARVYPPDGKNGETCQLLLRDEGAGDGGEPVSEPALDLVDGPPGPDAEPMPEPPGPDSEPSVTPDAEPVMEPPKEPVDAAEPVSEPPDAMEPSIEPSLEPSEPSDAAEPQMEPVQDVIGDGGDAGPDEPIIESTPDDGGVCENPSPYPDAPTYDSPPNLTGSWVASGGGEVTKGNVAVHNGITAGGIGVYKPTGDVYIGGQVDGFQPVWSNNNNNVIVNGFVHGSTSTSDPVARAFVAKIDASGQWKAVAMSDDELVAKTTAIAVDQRPLAAQGGTLSIYAVGTVDRSGRSRGLRFGNHSFYLSGPSDGFLVKCKDNGAAGIQTEWIAGLGGGDADIVTSVVVDSRGDILVAGIAKRDTMGNVSFTSHQGFDTATFKTLDSTGVTMSTGVAYAYFVAKISASGRWRWATLVMQGTLPPTGLDNSNGLVGEPKVAVNSRGEIWVAGSFWGTPRWIGGATLATTGDTGAFVLKLGTRFNAKACKEEPILLAATMGDNANANPKIMTRIGGLDVDSKGDAYIAGACNAAITHTNASGASATQACGTNNIFVAKILTHGSGSSQRLEWQPVAVSSTQAQSNGEVQEVRGLAVEPGGDRLYIAGLVTDSADFVPQRSGATVVHDRPAVAPKDDGMFLAKLEFFPSGTAGTWDWVWAIFGGRDIMRSTGAPADKVIRGFGVALTAHDVPIFLGRMAPGGTFAKKTAKTAAPPLSSVFVIKVPTNGKVP